MSNAICCFCNSAPVPPGRRSYCSAEHARLAAREQSRERKRQWRRDNSEHYRDWWDKHGGGDVEYNRYFARKMREYRARKRAARLSAPSHSPKKDIAMIAGHAPAALAAGRSETRTVEARHVGAR